LFLSPPGTGKTYIGVELIRVLLKNGIGPLLMIAFTNHALDHMLSSVLDADITKKIVRLGTRSGDERISKFNIETLELIQEESRLDRTIKTEYRLLKEAEKDMDELMSVVRTVAVTGLQVDDYIQIQYADEHASLHSPPPWVAALIKDQHSGWRTAGAMSTDDSLYSFWERGDDLGFLKTYNAKPPSPHKGATTNRYEVLGVHAEEPSDDEEDSDPLKIDTLSINPDIGPASSWMQSWPTDEIPPAGPDHDVNTTNLESPEDSLPLDPADPIVQHDTFFSQFNLTVRPEIPTTNRLISDLLGPGSDIWGFSREERTSLSRYWKDAVHLSLVDEHTHRFSRLRNNYENARVRYNEVKDQVCRYCIGNFMAHKFYSLKYAY
jgi:AAA domain